MLLIALMWLPATLVAVLLGWSFARPDLVAATVVPFLGARSGAATGTSLD
jgi:hypothetical protein